MNLDELNNRPSIGVSMSEMTSSSESPAENAEEMREQIRALTNECNALKQVLPRLENKQGTDITDEITKLANELSHYRSMSEQWESTFAKADQEHVRFKRKVLAELQTKEDKIAEMTVRADALEKENRDLKRKVEDDESKIFKLTKQAGGDTHGNDMSILSADESGDFHGTNLSKTMESRPMERSLNDLEYVIGQMMGVLAQLELGQGESDDLRKKIVTFLRKNGHHVNLANVISLAKEFDDKLKNDREGIRDTNQELASEYRDNSELRNLVRELSQDSEVTRSDKQDSTRFIRAKNKSFENTIVLERMQLLRSVCGQLFDKLQGTAHFLQSILEHLGDSEEARDLIQKISEIHLELNRSMGEAQLIADEIQQELSIPVEQISIELDDSSDEEVFAARANARVTELEQEVEKLRVIEKQYEAVKSALNAELMVKEELKTKHENEMDAIRHQQAAKEKEVEELNKCATESSATIRQLETYLGEKNVELINIQHEVDTIRDQLDAKEKECEEMDKCTKESSAMIRELETYLGEKNAELMNIEREMDVLRSQLVAKEMEVEEMNKCAKESSAMIRENNKKLFDRIVSGTGHELEEIYKTLTSAASSSKVVSQSHSHKKAHSVTRGQK